MKSGSSSKRISGVTGSAVAARAAVGATERRSIIRAARTARGRRGRLWVRVLDMGVYAVIANRRDVILERMQRVSNYGNAGA